MSKKSKKISGDYILDILRANYNNDASDADILIDNVFKEIGVKRVVGPPPTNMSPYQLAHDTEVTDENEGKSIHVSSGDKEWAIVSYYEAYDGHMCIDIEEV